MENGSGLSLCGRDVFPEDNPEEATSESVSHMLQDTPVFYGCKYERMACKISNNHAMKTATRERQETGAWDPSTVALSHQLHPKKKSKSTLKTLTLKILV